MLTHNTNLLHMDPAQKLNLWEKILFGQAKPSELSYEEEQRIAEQEAERRREEEYRLEEEQRRREKERKRIARHNDAYRGDYSSQTASIIGDYIKEKEYYQQETGFVHDGLITIEELGQYEDQIHRRAKTNKTFIKRFRRRMAEMMIVDENYARIMKEYSPEYDQLAELAQEQQKKLEWTANVSGFSKALHAIGKDERQRARDRLAQLKKAKASDYRSQYDKISRAEEWQDKTSKFARRDERVYEDMAESVKEHVAQKYIPTDAMRTDEAAWAHHYGKKILQHTADKVLTGVAAFSAAEQQFSWEHVVKNAQIVLKANGQIETAPEEQEKIFDHITNTTNKWAENIYKDDAVREFDKPFVDPASYLNERNRNKILDYKEQCKQFFYIFQFIKSGSVYETLSKARRDSFDEAAIWAEGYYRWFEELNKNMTAWDRYYNSTDEEKATMEEDMKPQQVRRLTSFFQKY